MQPDGKNAGASLTVVVPGRCEGVDHFAIRYGESGVEDMRRDHMYTSGGEEYFFAADDHFQFAFDDIGDLFVDMMMFGGDAAFFYIPEYEGAGVAVDHFTEKTGERIFGRDIIQVLHIEVVSSKILKKRVMIVDKWKIGAGASRVKDVDLRKFQSNENYFDPDHGRNGIFFFCPRGAAGRLAGSGGFADAVDGFFNKSRFYPAYPCPGAGFSHRYRCYFAGFP